MPPSRPHTTPNRLIAATRARLPGLAACTGVTAIAYALEAAEHAAFGRAWLEALVLAIVTGTAIRSVWTPDPRHQPGIAFCASTLLEISVVLLGLSVSTTSLLAIGPLLMVGIAAIVAVSLLLGFAIGRTLGLPARMALLVACGNAICGNSAIAAVAPVIRADSRDVAAAIAFTAVLGVAVVLTLPFIGIALAMQDSTYGAFAGLTVYAVPQVLAATAPFGSVAMQVGTVVKLVRVLMLGPVCVTLSLVAALFFPGSDTPHDETRKHGRIFRFVPWFIIGFLILVAFRSTGLVPGTLVALAKTMATGLTVMSMGALGLGVDLGSVARAGLRVALTVTLSLLGLATLSLIVLRLLPGA